VPCEINHIIDGGRVSHDHVYGLSSWFHRGICDEGMTPSQMTAAYGPSLGLGSKTFHDRFGSDQVLLEYQCRVLELPLPTERWRPPYKKPSKICAPRLIR
jgi:hypothetical protein